MTKEKIISDILVQSKQDENRTDSLVVINYRLRKMTYHELRRLHHAVFEC